MATIELFNFYYFLYLAFAVILTFTAIKYLNHKTDKFRYWFIFGLIMINFSIHFLKLFIFPYNDTYFVPHPIVKVSFENICAVSVLTFPILYFVKNKVVRQYMVLIGLLSGILALTIPVDVFSTTFNAVDITGIYTKTAFQIETIRFYTTHFLLFLAPFLLLYFKMETLTMKRAKWMPWMLLLVLFVLYANEWVLSLFGLVPDGMDMYNPDGRNPSLIFGVKNLDSLTGIGNFVKVLVPRFLTVNPGTGETFFWPVLWLFFPVMIYGYLLATITNFIYDKEGTIQYYKEILPPANQKKEENAHETRS